MRGRDADVFSDCGDGARRIARDHLELHSLAPEEVDGFGRVRTQPLGKDHNAQGFEVARRLRCGTDRLVKTSCGGRNGDDSTPLILLCGDTSAELAEIEVLRRAENQAERAHTHTAPAPAREKRNVPRGLLGFTRQRLGDRIECGVPGGLTCSVASEALAEELAVDSRRGDVVDDPQRRLGQRAGLVETDHVDGGKRLDCVQLLGQSTAPRHPESRERVGQTHQEDQPFRNQRHDRRDRRGHSLACLRLALEQRVAEDRAKRDHDADQQQEEPVHVELERRSRVAKLASDIGDALRVAVGTDRRHDVRSSPLEDERARPNGLAGLALDRSRLASEDRLVDAKAVTLTDVAVSDQLVSLAHLDEIVPREPRRRRPGARLRHG